LYVLLSNGILHNAIFNSQTIGVKVIGEQGGEIADPSGFMLTIPAGALQEDISISAARDPNPPAMPAGVTAAGPAFKVNLPAGTQLLAPMELLIPLERQPGVSDEAYAAFLWDGSQWNMVGGSVEGNAIRVSTLHFSEFQVGVDEYRGEWDSILFRHITDYPADPRVTGIIAWRYTLDSGGVPANSIVKPERLYIPVHMSGVRYPGLWNAATYPPGIYTLWCAEWAEPEQASSGNRLQTYHLYVPSNVRPACEINAWALGQCEPPPVPYTLPAPGAGLRGPCGQDNGQPVQLTGTSTATLIRTRTPTATPRATSTATPTLFLTPTATISTPPFIISIDFPTEIPGDRTDVPGTIKFSDPDKDVILVDVQVVYASQKFDPASWDPTGDIEYYTDYGLISYKTWCSSNQIVILEFTLKDAAGNVSNPVDITFTCQ
jgi:hypothetical protein